MADVAKGSTGYWNLCSGEREFPYYGDPLSPVRQAVWEQWRAEIMSSYFWMGRRPDAWWWFDFPPLCEGVEWIAAMPDEEFFALSNEEVLWRMPQACGDFERAQIESRWRQGISHARHAHPTDATAARQHAITVWKVPAWFYDKETT